MDAETRARELLAGGLIGLREAIAAALRRARAEAIEECARRQCADCHAGVPLKGNWHQYSGGREILCDAAVIRALSPAPEAGHGPEPTIEPRERRPAQFRLTVKETPPPLPIEEAERG